MEGFSRLDSIVEVSSLRNNSERLGHLNQTSRKCSFLHRFLLLNEIISTDVNSLKVNVTF